MHRGYPAAGQGGLADARGVATGLCSTCSRRDVRGRFLIGWVRSSRKSPRAAAPAIAVTGEGKDRRGDYQGTLADASSHAHPGLGGCTGMTGTGRWEAAGGGHGDTDGQRNRCPRGREGARPGPGLMRAERGNPVRVRRAGAGMRRQGGRPTVRGAEFPGRTGCPGSGCRAAERRQESGAAGPGTPPGWLSYNWPGCRILLSGLERALTWAGEPLRRERAYVPELMGKLDTSVNGPEGLPPFDGDAWERTDWRHHEGQVRRLRGRIFKAVQEGDWPSARNVQKLLLRSWSNTLVSVRQVTQRNTGRATAGIDGLVALTSQARAEMAVQVHASIGSHQPSPVRRVYVPKARDKAKMRPLGIPVISDRCHQARVRNALEPEWEARFEPRSYGFRPGRGCHDAIQSLFNTLCGKSKRVWILDADLAGAFDKISHGHLLEMLGGFPARGMIAGWLKAGVFEAGKGFAPTGEGTPQGGIISPLLLNIALHGLEEAAGVRYRAGTQAGRVQDGCPALTRYADDRAPRTPKEVSV